VKDTLNQIKNVEETLKQLRMNSEWMLVSPNGKLYKGSVDYMFSILAPHHSLLKMPSFTCNKDMLYVDNEALHSKFRG